MKKNALLFLLLGLQTGTGLFASQEFAKGREDEILGFCMKEGLLEESDRHVDLTYHNEPERLVITGPRGVCITVFPDNNVRFARSASIRTPDSLESSGSEVLTGLGLLKSESAGRLAYYRSTSSSPKTVATSPQNQRSPSSLSSRDSSPSSPVDELSTEGAGRLVGMIAGLAPFDSQAHQVVVRRVPTTSPMAASLPGVSRGGGALSAAFQQGSAAGGYAELDSRSSESGSDSSCRCC